MGRQLTWCVVVSVMAIFALARAAPPDGGGRASSNRVVASVAAQRLIDNSKVPPSGIDALARAPARHKRSGRVSQFAGGGFRTIVTAPVDYRNDEGTRLRNAGLLNGPLPFLSSGESAVATAGACTFDIECDDGDPCTRDECIFAPGAQTGSGKCANPGAGDGFDGANGGDGCLLGRLCGGCDDGIVCNGYETCQGGVCITPSCPP